MAFFSVRWKWVVNLHHSFIFTKWNHGFPNSIQTSTSSIGCWSGQTWSTQFLLYSASLEVSRWDKQKWIVICFRIKISTFQLNRLLIGQFILVHALKLFFYTMYLVTNLILLKKQVNEGFLILVILFEGLAMCELNTKFQFISLSLSLCLLSH